MTDSGLEFLFHEDAVGCSEEVIAQNESVSVQIKCQIVAKNSKKFMSLFD